VARTATLASLTFLYLAQGIPFGLASEYLPVMLRKSGYTLSAIAALSYLQLPWQLKIFWAKLGDLPSLRSRTRRILLGLQMTLAVLIALYTIFSLKEAPAYWFVLTAMCALVAATQDVFTDAFAVRALTLADRGYGNIAQVAGYRVGMLAGGAGLLVLGHILTPRTTLLACAGLVFATSLAAFAVTEEQGRAPAAKDPTPPSSAAGTGRGTAFRTLAAHVFSGPARGAILLAFTFKLGMHVQSGLIKPMLVDAKWSEADIGLIAVTVGTAMSLLGAFLGGVAHRVLREARALGASAVAQATVALPVIFAFARGAPRVLTGIAVASEHFASGFGTTVLFAALMTATRKRDAGFHYTVLTSANAVAIGLGGLLGGIVADHTSKTFALGFGGLVCLAPLLFIRNWDATAQASST
jgi:predicted MFS family arabinose efflux permease